MKKLFLFAMTVACLSIFNACEKSEELIDQSVDLQLQATEKPDVYSENGYLVFNTKDAFEQKLNQLKKGDQSILDELKLDKKFVSLKCANNQSLMLKSTDVGTENVNEDDELVKDPYLQELLNNEREIVVDGKLYKITDQGMLRTDPEDLEQLNNFIESNPDFSSIENNPEVDEFLEVDDNIELFLPRAMYILEPEPEDPYSGGGSGGSSTTTSDLRNIDLANLTECDESSKTWAGEMIAGVLGYHVDCENNFASDKRVKTVFWAQNWFFVSSVGIKVKMQDRLLGIWWGEDAQVLELGWDMVKYEVKFNIQPSYYSLMLSPEVIETEFKDVFWIDILKNISKQFKLEKGRYPEGVELHTKLCEQNYKEWTRRNITTYGDFADLNFYTLKKNKSDIDFKLAQYGTKTGYEVAKELLNKYSSSYGVDQEAFSTLNNLIKKNFVITIIYEDMTVERAVMPFYAAKTSYNNNKMEYLFDYSAGAVEFGVRLSGDNPMFGVKFYKAPAEYKILSGSRIYGLAKYKNSWRGSFIRKD